MADDGINMPTGFGGLMRFKDEYDSFLNLKPVHVIVFIILIVVFRVLLQIFMK
ncbi:MAG: preprotein translocase subunit Sec61beta [Candidatus Pacearchaeota archaeon]|nr:preprotein translocase subunit Sec61beta [Candidatus Pacearchaeota archaeon]